MCGVVTSTCSFGLRSVRRDVGERTWQAPLVSEVSLHFEITLQSRGDSSVNGIIYCVELILISVHVALPAHSRWSRYNLQVRKSRIALHW
jgi:hypothetical protein